MTRPQAITKLKDAPSHGKYKWLIYADSGIGKTVLAGTAPRSLFLTVEAGGTESAKKFGSTADEWVIETMDDVVAAEKYFSEGTGSNDYDWVIIDSVSEIEDRLWRIVQKESTTKKIQDYGTIDTLMTRFIDTWNRLPVNVIYTSHAKRLDVESPDGSGDDTTMLLPSVGTKTGVLSQRICAKVTLVGYLTVYVRKDEEGKREEVRRLWTKGGKRWLAKNRHSGKQHQGYYDNPNVADIIAEIEGNAVAAARPAKATKTTNTSE